MGKYKFKLQKLLDIRKDKEEQSKLEFQKAKKESMMVERRLNTLQHNYDRYRDLSKSKSAVEQKITNIYLKSLDYGINEAEGELAGKSKIVEEKRIELKQRQIERKTVDILKEKEKEAFIKEENRLEQKQNDEFALYGFIRKMPKYDDGERR